MTMGTHKDPTSSSGSTSTQQYTYPPTVPGSSSSFGGRRESIDDFATPQTYNGNEVGNGTKRQKRENSSSDMFGLAEEVGDNRPLAITCAPCRAKKIKCDSKKPHCDNCAKSPSECYYPLKLKPGLRAGTGTDMMKRLEQLEERVHIQEARLAQQEARLASFSPDALVNYANNQTLHTSQSSLTPLLNLPSMPMSTQSMPPPLPELTSIPSVPASNGIGMDFFGGPITGSMGGVSNSPSGFSATSFHDPLVLPPADIVYDLLNIFWTHIHPWAPILSPVPIPLHPPWNIVVHAIVVVTIRLSSDSRLDGKHDQYKRAAKQHVLAHAIESTSISSVQALALLALDLIGSDQGPSSWGILALLTRSAVHLGLTSESDTNGSNNSFTPRVTASTLSRTSIIPSPTTWEEDESRRRLFWLIFSLDRYACASTGWDFALPDFEINRRLPCSDEIWAGTDWYITPTFKPIPHLLLPHDPTTFSPFAYLIEALDLLGRSHTLQSQTIDPNDARAVDRRRDGSVTLSSSARRWFGDLPFRDGPQNAMTLMIQAIYHATLLKLNAYYAYPALSNGDPVEPYTSTCLSSIKAMVALCHQARDVGFAKSSSPLFIWASWVAARVLFIHAFLSHRDGPDEDFDVIVSFLKESARYWTLANQYVKLLERARRKWLQSSSNDVETNPNLPDAIHVLLDLRRTAYTAVVANSSETPYHSPGELNLSHLPAWAVQPLLGDLHSWFDLPANVFSDMT